MCAIDGFASGSKNQEYRMIVQIATAILGRIVHNAFVLHWQSPALVL